MSNEHHPAAENPDVPIYDMAGAAEYLKVSRQTIWRWINSGHLPAQRVGIRGTYRIRRDDLDAMVRAA